MHQPHLSRSSRWFLLVRSSCAFIHCTETLTICKRNFDDFKWKGSEQSIPRTKWTSNLSDHWSLGVLCSVKLHSLHCLISVSGSMLNPLSPFINVIWFQVFILWTIKGQKCSCSEADYDDGLFFFIDVELLHWLSAYPTKCNEWTRRLVTASPLPLVTHVHQWLHCMLQITACFRYTPPSTDQWSHPLSLDSARDPPFKSHLPSPFITSMQSCLSYHPECKGKNWWSELLRVNKDPVYNRKLVCSRQIWI